MAIAILGDTHKKAFAAGKKIKISFLTIVLILCSSIGGFIYGYDLGVFSGVMPFLEKQFTLNSSELGILGGAIFLGGIFGALCTGYLSDRFGRKQMIIASGAVFFIGLIILLLSPGFYELLIARFVIGLGVGIIQVAVPTYLSEMAPTNIRGSAIVVFQLFITVGILGSYLVDYWLTPYGSWELMYAVMGIPCLLLMVLMLFMPQSTRWLKFQKHVRASTAILEAKKAGHAVDAHAINPADRESKWRDLFNYKYRRTVFIILAVAVLNQLTAINAFLQYAPSVFQKSGFISASSGMEASIILGVTNLLGTVIAMLLVDRVGRTWLLKIGTAGITVAYIFLAIVTAKNLSPVLSVVGLTAFILFFAAGPGSVVWLVLSELLPTQIRGKGVALGLFFNSLASWIVSTVFFDVQEKMGLSGSYIVFAVFTALYFLIAMKVPEANHQSLDELEKGLPKKIGKKRK
jgi:sugar porter (SP) family MFS transporter